MHARHRALRALRAPSVIFALLPAGLLLACGGDLLASEAPEAVAHALVIPAPPPAASVVVDASASVPTPLPAPAYLPGRPFPDPWASPPAARDGLPPPEISAAAAIVLDEASMAVLFAHHAHDRRAPASLTKIATAILVAERGGLDDLVTVDVDSRTMRRSTVMGLEPDDEFTLLDLLYGLMLPSGNDAALAIARHVSGSEFRFAEEMTELTWRLGLEDSRFTNPHGLGGRGHYTSAYDLAVLSRYLMTFPVLAEVVAARSWTAEGSRTIQMSTLNSLLYTYAGADGLKTGYTRGAGKTYAGSAVRDGHRVYVVLLDAPSREEDARRLLDWAFAAHSWPEPVASPAGGGAAPES